MNVLKYENPCPPAQLVCDAANIFAACKNATSGLLAGPATEEWFPFPSGMNHFFKKYLTSCEKQNGLVGK